MGRNYLCSMALLMILFTFVACGSGSAGEEILPTDSDFPVDAVIVTQDSNSVSVAVNDELSEKRLQEELLTYRNNRITELFTEELELKEQARAVVGNCVSNVSYVTIEAKERFDYSGYIIDELTGNPVLSEATKAAIKAGVEKKGVAEIVEETCVSAMEELPGYIESELQGQVSDAVGIDVFSAADFISSWQNADAVPSALLQCVADDQRADVAKLELFLCADEISSIDILAVAQTLCSVNSRQQEMAVAVNESFTDFRSEIMLLQRIASRISEIEGQCRFYSSAKFEAPVKELSASEMEELKKWQEAMLSTMGGYSDLAALSLGMSGSSYDVRGFMDAQRNTTRQGVIGGVFGSLFGGIISDNSQSLEDDIQKNRAKLYTSLTKSLRESYLTMLPSQMSFLKEYAFLSLAGDGDNLDLYFVREIKDEVEEKHGLKDAGDIYLSFLEKYGFDLAVAYSLEECILSEYQTAFLRNVYQEQQSVLECINSHDPGWCSGYSIEEQTDRYMEVLSLYIAGLDYTQLRAGSQGITPGFEAGPEVKEYGTGTFVSYTNKGEIIMIIQLDINEHIYSGEGIHYYFDKNGDLIFVSHRDNYIGLFHNQIRSYSLANEKDLSLYLEMAQKAYGKFSTQ